MSTSIEGLSAASQLSRMAKNSVRRPALWLLCCGLVSGLLATGNSRAAEPYTAVSGPRQLKEINFQMTPETDGGAYYFVAEGGWQATGCVNARYAYVPETWSGAKSALAIALTAKTSGRSVRVAGFCGDSSNDPAYMRVHYITME